MPKRGGRSVRAVGRTTAAFGSMRREEDPISHMSLTAKAAMMLRPATLHRPLLPQTAKRHRPRHRGHRRSRPRPFLRGNRARAGPVPNWRPHAVCGSRCAPRGCHPRRSIGVAKRGGAHCASEEDSDARADACGAIRRVAPRSSVQPPGCSARDASAFAVPANSETPSASAQGRHRSSPRPVAGRGQSRQRRVRVGERACSHRARSCAMLPSSGRRVELTTNRSMRSRERRTTSRAGR